jgi:hypothetical protein
MSYTLNARQQAVYTHTCDLYSTSRDTNTDGKGTPGPEVITLEYANVPCRFAQTGNIDDPTGVGRIKRVGIFTSDVLHLHSDQVVHNGWWVRNTTLKADGSPETTFGDVYSVIGAPQRIPGSSRRPSQKQSVMLAQEEHPPAEVS